MRLVAPRAIFLERA